MSEIPILAMVSNGIGLPDAPICGKKYATTILMMMANTNLSIFIESKDKILTAESQRFFAEVSEKKECRACKNMVFEVLNVNFRKSDFSKLNE